MHRDEQGRRQFRDDDSYRSNYEGRSRFEDRDDYRGRGYDMSGRDNEDRYARYDQERYGRYDQDRYGRNSDAWNRNVMQSAYGDDYRYRQERWSPSESRYGSGGYYGNEMSRRYDSPNYGMSYRTGQGARDWYGSGEGYGSSWYRDPDSFSPYRSYGPSNYGMNMNYPYAQGGQQYGQSNLGQGYYGQQYGQGYNGPQQYGQGYNGPQQYGQREYYGSSYNPVSSNYNPSGQGYNVAPGGYSQPSDNSNYASGGGYNQGRYSNYDQGRSMSSYGDQGRYGSFGSGYGYQGRNMRSQIKGPKGYKRSDDRIREDICDRLSMQDIDSSEIEVMVSNGDVTLSGTVADRSMKYDAEQICDAVLGVNEINNQLRIKRMNETMQTGTGSSYASGSNDAESTTRTGTRNASQGRS